MRLSDEDFFYAVKTSILIAVDLIIKDERGRVLLGKRLNAPAKGTWFVPGGRLFKGERLEEAILRITKDEIGQSLNLSDLTLRGFSEHFYQENALGRPNIGTQYFLLVAETILKSDAELFESDQHGEMRFFSGDEILNNPEVHPYTRSYFESTPSEFLPFTNPTKMASRGQK